MKSTEKRLPSFREVRNTIQRVDGWLTEHEASYLYSLAQYGPGQGAIVEIGSWKGKSTILLAAGSKSAGREKVHAVDHHKGGPDQAGLGYQDVNTEIDFRKNIKSAGIEDQVIPLVMTSTRAAQGWSGPIRLLWIDGDHSYEAVKTDLLLWEPHVVEGGVIAFHDTYAWEGPRRVVEEYLLRSNRFSSLGFVDSITAVKKTQRRSPWDKIRKKIILLIRYLYILGRQHILPGEIRKWSKSCLRVMASAR